MPASRIRVEYDMTVASFDGVLLVCAGVFPTGHAAPIRWESKLRPEKASPLLFSWRAHADTVVLFQITNFYINLAISLFLFVSHADAGEDDDGQWI
jgi:hypothetical protein